MFNVWGMLSAFLVLAALLVFGFKKPLGILAVYFNGLFIATLFLTNTGIPYFASGSVLLVTVVCLLVDLMKREEAWREFWQYSRGILPLLAVLIGLDMCLAFLYSNHSAYGALKIIRYLTVNLVLFFGILILVNKEEKFQELLKWIGFLGVVYAFSSLLGLAVGSLGAIYGWNNQIWFSRALGLTLLTLYYFVGFRKQGRYGLLLLTGVFFLFMMYLQASRGPVLALYCSLVVYELFNVSGEKLARRGMKLLVASLLFLFFFSSHSPLASFLEDKTATIIKNNQAPTIAEKFDNTQGGTGWERLVQWKASWGIYKEHPLLGVGTGSLANMLPKIHDEQYRYPHNIVMEVLAEQGLPGILLWLAFMIYPAVMAIRGIWRKDPAAKAYLFGLVLLVNGVANAMFSGDVTDNAYIFVAGAMIWMIGCWGKKRSWLGE